MEAKNTVMSKLLQELCGGCLGCSTMPTSIEQLCDNPLEKYLYRKCQSVETEGEAYFRGRKDGLIMLEANKGQARKAGIKEVVDWTEENGKEMECLFEDRIGEIAIDYDEWQAQLQEWGIET